MRINDYIRMMAGLMVLISLTLSQVHSPYWLFLTAFVGLNLLQSAFTKWCLAEDILVKLGVEK